MNTARFRKHSERIWLGIIAAAWLGLWLCSIFWPGWPSWHDLMAHYAQYADRWGLR